jgi:NTE family protein
VACEDLITKREIRLAAGELRTVLEASYALPVYFPPVPYEGHLLVDGGITNLVPLGTAMEYSPHVIVSSTFYDARGLNLRNPLVILNTSIDIGKRRAGVADLQEYPDALWIRCSVESFSFMSFDRLAELESEGYRSADANAAGIAALKAAAYGAPAAAFAGEPPGVPGDEAEEAFARRLDAVRAGNDDALAVGYRAWAPFGRAPSARPAFALKPSVTSVAWPGDPFFLNDSLYAGLGAEFRWRALELSLDGGFEWSPYGGPSATKPETDRAFMPSVGGVLRLYASPWLRAEARAVATFESLGEDPSLGLYHRSGFEATFPGPRLSVSSFVELSGVGAGGGATLWTSGLGLGPYRSEGSGEAPAAGLTAAFGHQYWEPGGLRAPAQLAYAGLSLWAKTASGLAMQAEARGRFAALGEAAPIFPSDPFSLARASVLTGGRGVVASSIWLGWAPPKAALSLAELLLVRSPRLGVFAEAAWSTGELSGASGAPAAPDGLIAGAGAAGAGIRARFDLSLIGLKSAGFWAELGWDLGRQEPFARIFIGPAGR